ncbi:NAD(P)-binding protein [Bosea vaviloviae]|uniref:NAD(P)-binding protein n=1 Tax=Bosea vaviloviae TaxID=1526658 RepID=UPI000A94B1E6|nr:NAD(P)-binding protein [Bosea vaviloviae]
MKLKEIVEAYRIGDLPLMVLGTYEKGVTVYAQQVRALNLAYGLVEGGTVPTAPRPAGNKFRIAVVGGGFAGLTFAAALIAKGVAADIDLFEKRDTLLPLQHGSDARWLHPRIYDWPDYGSKSQVAMLPLLNWTAGRASDVVVQTLAEWAKLTAPRESSAETLATNIRVFCNSRHLQVDRKKHSKYLRVEWVGERRKPDGTIDDQHPTPRGDSENYNLVVVAMGFGLERDEAHSYWRNDVAGQPGLDGPRRTYIVSGQGDGAMIDLLRIRVSQFRQDRILDELFPERAPLLGRLRKLRDMNGAAQFEALEKLWRDPSPSGLRVVGDALAMRLRRDTEAVLHLKVRRMADLFGSASLRISFQNKLLVYLLYKCGGFVPSDHDLDRLKREHNVEDRRVIRRHGTNARADLAAVLSDGLSASLREKGEDVTAGKFPGEQPSTIEWQGGFFGFRGQTKVMKSLSEEAKAEWRKEYLPDATKMMASGLSSAIAGVLIARKKPSRRLRVTLHRAMTLGQEELLQQCCEYAGQEIDDTRASAGRTLNTGVATIGQAYKTRRIVRSRKAVDRQTLDKAMNDLKLNDETRRMSRDVSFVAAIPILEPEIAGGFAGKSPVAGILYLDAMDPTFFLDDHDLEDLSEVIRNWLLAIERPGAFGRIQNVEHPPTAAPARPGSVISDKAKDALEVVFTVAPPQAKGPFHINFDYTDLAGLSSSSAESGTGSS